MAERYIGEIVPVERPTPLNNAVDPEKLKLWRDYTKGESRKARELLRDSSINDPTIRQQSVAVYTAPSKKFLIDCGDISIMNLVHSPDGSLRQQFASDRRLTKEIAMGILYWYSLAAECINADRFISEYYQNAIYSLLPPLYDVDEKLALKIFELYELREFKAYDGDSSCSRYQPVRGLLSDPDMPRKIKDLALAKWFEIARQEESGAIEPRAPHERAIRWMANYTNTIIYGDNPDKITAIYIVRFLEEISKPNTTYMGHLDNIAGVAKLIDDRELRYNFARRNIMFDEKFCVHENAKAELVKWVLKLARKKGQSDCAAKAQRLLDDYSEYLQRKKARAEAKASEENALLGAIRD